MVVKKEASRVNSESGQSMIELLFLVPFCLGILFLMIRANSAVQTSIVNQQYARAQTLFLTYGSPVYPRTGFQSVMTSGGFNQMVIGVADNLFDSDEDNFYDQRVRPQATVRTIVPRNKPRGSTEPQSEPRERTDVRVRTTVTLCTQPNFIPSNGSNLPINSTNLSLNSRFDYCRGPR